MILYKYLKRHLAGFKSNIEEKLVCENKLKVKDKTKHQNNTSTLGDNNSISSRVETEINKRRKGAKKSHKETAKSICERK